MVQVPECTRLSPLCKWKHIFLRVAHLMKNWSKGRYCVAPILRGHTDKVNALDCEGMHFFLLLFFILVILKLSRKIMHLFDLKSN